MTETIDNGVNVENMLALADLIEKCDSFDLGDWGRYVGSQEDVDNECGTVCCIAGWENVRIKNYLHDDAELETEKRYLLDIGYDEATADKRINSTMRNKINFSDSLTAMESLGLDYNQRSALFFRDSYFWRIIAMTEHGTNQDGWEGYDDDDPYKYGKWMPTAKDAADVLRRIARNELLLEDSFDAYEVAVMALQLGDDGCDE